jgi:cyclin-dependent kinase regulatory subunit CKS1
MLKQLQEKPEYSERYFDDQFEYRYVVLPREMAAELKNKKILTEDEWRGMGITQSRGWAHYGFHKYIFTHFLTVYLLFIFNVDQNLIFCFLSARLEQTQKQDQ